MATAYLDTSVFLRLLFNEPYKKIDLLKFEKIVSSELIEIESRRRLSNMRLQGQIEEEEVNIFSVKINSMLNAIDLIQLTRPIIIRSKHSMAIQIRTLDFLHLCSALYWREIEERDLTILTHDLTFGRASQILGFETIGMTSEYNSKK